MKLHVKPFIITGFFLFFTHILMSQHTFEQYWGGVVDDKIMGVCEDSDGNFYLRTITRKTSTNRIASIIKLNPLGEIVNEKIFDIPDSSFFINTLYVNSEDDLIVIGKKGKKHGEYPGFIFMKLDSDLNTIIYKEYTIPENYKNIYFQDVVLINKHQNYVFGGVAKINTYNQTGDYYFMEMDKNGDTLKTNIYPDEGTLFINDFILNPDSISYSVFGKYMAASYSFQKATVDSNLNITNIIGLTPSYEYNGPLTAKNFSDSTILISNFYFTGPTSFGADLNIMELDKEGNIIQDYLWGNADTADYAFWYKSLDFKTKNSIFWGGNIGIYGAWDDTPLTFTLINLNENLEPNWQRFYGGDHHYEIYTLLATQDGGCIMVGLRENCDDHTNGEDFYVLKVNAEGMISTNDSHFEVSDAIVYPNPGNSVLHLQCGVPHFHFELYDSQGLCVYHQKNIYKQSTLNINHLSTGVYIYRFYNKQGIIEQGKWVKN